MLEWRLRWFGPDRVGGRAEKRVASDYRKSSICCPAPSAGFSSVGSSTSRGNTVSTASGAGCLALQFDIFSFPALNPKPLTPKALKPKTPKPKTPEPLTPKPRSLSQAVQLLVERGRSRLDRALAIQGAGISRSNIGV